jgi:hypothetical protein
MITFLYRSTDGEFLTLFINLGVLRGSRKGVKNETCLLCLGKEDTKHSLLECPETKNWRTEMLCKRWLGINEEAAYKKMQSCTNKMTVKNMGKFLFRVQCKWERMVKKTRM